MGALFISLEHELTEIDLSPQASALAEHEELLAEVADELHVPHLMHFFHRPVDDDNPASASQEESHSETHSEDDEDDDLEEAEELWFEAAEGRNTIESLQHHYDDHPEEAPDGVIDELQVVDEILAQAEEHDIRWHFDMDF